MDGLAIGPNVGVRFSEFANCNAIISCFSVFRIGSAYKNVKKGGDVGHRASPRASAGGRVTGVMPQMQQELGPLSTLEELPVECWVCIILQSAEPISLIRAVPVVSMALRQTFGDPWLRSCVLRGRKLWSSAGDARWDGDEMGGIVAVVKGREGVGLCFREQLTRRAALSRWQQQQVALMHSAIARHSLRTCRRCVEEDGFRPGHQDAIGRTPLYLAMKHDFVEGLPLLIRADTAGAAEQQRHTITLPAPDACTPALEYHQPDGWNPIFAGAGLTHQGQNLLQLCRAGVVSARAPLR